MQITKYKFSCVSWQTDSAGEVIKSTEKLDEIFFEDSIIIEARRKGLNYLKDHLKNIHELQDSLEGKTKFAPLVYHLRLYFVTSNDSRYCIYSVANYDVSPVYSQDVLRTLLDAEVDVYLDNGYELGGDVHHVLIPGQEKTTKVLYDTALDMQQALQNH